MTWQTHLKTATNKKRTHWGVLFLSHPFIRPDGLVSAIIQGGCSATQYSPAKSPSPVATRIVG